MARIRSIHPGLYTDEAWASVSISARWLGMGLLTEADDNGVFEWKPLQLKMRLFPADAVDVPSLLAELVAAGVLCEFNAEAKRLGAVRNFCKYQRPRKPKAWFPITAEVRGFVALGCEPVSDQDEEPSSVPKKSAPAPVEVKVVPSKSEKSPQMEDGGGRKKGRANALVPAVAATTIWDDVFASAWDAYPHFRGRGRSKAKTWPIWREQVRLCGSPEKLLEAIRQYARLDRQHKGECGAKGFNLWLSEGRWEHWLEGEAMAIPMSVFPDAEIRFACIEARGEGWTASWLDPAAWDGEARTIIPRNDFAAGKLRGGVSNILGRLNVHIQERAAA